MLVSRTFVWLVDTRLKILQILDDILFGPEDGIYPHENVFVCCCYRLHIIMFHAKGPNLFFVPYILVFGVAQSAWYMLQSDCVRAFSSASLPASNWHKLSELIVCSSVFMLYLAWKRGLPRKFARLVLFGPIEKRPLYCLVCSGSEQMVVKMSHHVA